MMTSPHQKLAKHPLPTSSDAAIPLSPDLTQETQMSVPETIPHLPILPSSPVKLCETSSEY